VNARVAATKVAIKHFEQFSVYVMKVFTHDYSVHGWSHGYHVDNLRVYFVPQQLGVAPEQTHVHFEMDVAHFDVNGFFIERDQHALFVFQVGGAVFFYGYQHLRIFANPTRTVKNNVAHFVLG